VGFSDAVHLLDHMQTICTLLQTDNHTKLTGNAHLLVDEFSGALCVGCLATVVTRIARMYAANGQ